MSYATVELFQAITVPVIIRANEEGKLVVLYSKGIINCIEDDYLITDAYIVPGTSGAPILDDNCYLAGIVGQLLYGNWSGGYGVGSINQLLVSL